MTPVGIRTVTQADRQALIDTLVLSFSADPCARYLFPKPETYLSTWPRFVTAMGGGALDHGGAFATDDGCAAALWLPPGIASDGDAIGAIVAEFGAPERLPVLAKVAELMEQSHPKEPHWYLAFVGTDPARQGLGLGSTLIKEGLRLCDEQGMPAYLESSSPRNIPLYERHGFEVMGVIQPDDFPGVYPMYRSARG